MLKDVQRKHTCSQASWLHLVPLTHQVIVNDPVPVRHVEGSTGCDCFKTKLKNSKNGAQCEFFLYSDSSSTHLHRRCAKVHQAGALFYGFGWCHVYTFDEEGEPTEFYLVFGCGVRPTMLSARMAAFLPTICLEPIMLASNCGTIHDGQCCRGSCE
jgi:hypothetical protein